MDVIDHITTNNSATYEVQDTVARTKANNLESVNYTDIGGGFADGNTFLVKTDDGMKKGYLNNFANWILDKLATKVYNQLATSNKTMIGALNELDSKKAVPGEIPEFFDNIDKINNTSIVIATNQSSGTLPKKIGGNKYVIITDALVNESGLIYAVQFAIGFGSSTIAIRNCDFTAARNGKYSEWRYI